MLAPVSLHSCAGIYQPPVQIIDTLLRGGDDSKPPVMIPLASWNRQGLDKQLTPEQSVKAGNAGVADEVFEILSADRSDSGRLNKRT